MRKNFWMFFEKSTKTATRNREGIPEVFGQFFFLSFLRISKKPLDLTNPHLDTRKIIKHRMCIYTSVKQGGFRSAPVGAKRVPPARSTP